MNSSLFAALSVLIPGQCCLCLRPLKHGFLCLACTPAGRKPGRRCQRCDAALSPVCTGDFCPYCTHSSLPFRTMRFLWEYKNRIPEFIHVMKYQPGYALTCYAAELLAEIAALFPVADWNAIVPIPGSHQTLLRRGFDQSFVLAKALSHRIQIPLAPLLVKKKSIKPQAQLGTQRRISNARKAFHLKKGLAPSRLLLIDDVYTTGATCWAAACCLRSGGTQVIDLLTLARAPRWQSYAHKLQAAYTLR